MACHCASSSGDHRVFEYVARVGMHARACLRARITWARHLAAQVSQQHEGRRIAQATLPFASRCFKATAFGANEREASASVAARRVELEEVEKDLGQTAFGVKWDHSNHKHIR